MSCAGRGDETTAIAPQSAFDAQALTHRPPNGPFIWHAEPAAQSAFAWQPHIMGVPGGPFISHTLPAARLAQSALVLQLQCPFASHTEPAALVAQYR